MDDLRSSSEQRLQVSLKMSIIVKPNIIQLSVFVGCALFLAPASDMLAATKTQAANTVFQEIERRVIGEYFDEALRRRGVDHDDDDGGNKKKGKGKNKIKAKHKGKSKGLPPGLVGRKDLPPGIQKQIAQGKRLPVDTRTYPLPDDLIYRLPTLSRDIDRRVVGDDIVLIQRGTNLILDVIENVLRAPK